MNGVCTKECQCVSNLEISPVHDPSSKIFPPKVFSRPFIPVNSEDIPTPSKILKWSYLDRIHQYIHQDDDDSEVGILIGANCPRALEPIEVIPSQCNGPYAFRSILGWCVTGPMFTRSKLSNNTRCNFVAFSEDKTPVRFIIQDQLKDNGLKDAMIAMFNQDFSENQPPNHPEKISIDDKRFLQLMDREARFIDGHYELLLPFRDPDVHVPNNRVQAVKRASSLKRKLLKNSKMYEDYIAFMKKIIDKGYAKKAAQPRHCRTWYLPHHGVYHPKKPDKIRVVFDCSATYDDISLNSMLMQGPDLTNQIVGVLTRFREDRIALVGDIESMFYQVRVPVQQQDMLRFMWWPDGNLDAELEDYVMCVHLFGGTHSPSTCNYALRKTAMDNIDKFGQDAASTLMKNFYVDDKLKGASDVAATLALKQNVKGMCAAGGFNLTQFMSNSRDVLEKIPKDEKAKGVKDVDLSVQSLPVERALGISWCVETDSFCFRIVLKDSPLTRRGILASISSVYDPLGFGAPFVLPAKQLLQQLCSERKGWDEDVSAEQRQIWEKWRNSLRLLQDIEIRHCIFSDNFGPIEEISLHHFSDASTSGHGQASYIRLVNSCGKIHCCFMIGKSRVTPLKAITVPRLELTAATTSTKVATQLKRELTLQPDFEVFWTDSKVVLGYISNVSKKFHLFVSNRLQAIHDASEVQQWRYVSTSENPADDSSRGQSVEKFAQNKRWLNGPMFLWQPFDVAKSVETFRIDDGDVEVRKDVKCMQINTNAAHQNCSLLQVFERVSSWYRLKRIIATVLLWRYKEKKIDVELLSKAESAIIRLVQKQQFPNEVEQLVRGSDKRLSKRKNTLSPLNPIIDEKGVIRVGGRISSSNLDWEVKHPIIFPRKHPVTALLIRHFHEKVQHGGRDATLNEIRQNRYMIVNASSNVRNEIFKCITCRRFRGRFGEQKMADLPPKRCLESAPFTYAGVDMFGHFLIKERRTELKRYVALFTCLSSRAIHLESTNSLDTDSFILALRRFINRRGEVRQIRSDNGLNFIGADAEMKKAIKEMDEKKLNEFFLRNNIDWMGWSFNTPTASHMGGIWERQIRSCRSILSSLLRNHGLSLNDESFRTVLTEAELIVNSRPLSTEAINDCNSLAPLTPNLLLTTKSKVVMAPPGRFTSADLYSRRRWRRVQHLVNEFWTRWRSEYLQSLQQRRKWFYEKRNFEIGDVVLLKDDAAHRNDWRLARIKKTMAGDDGNVRSVEVKTATGNVYERPVTKIILLVESGKETPTRSQ